MEQHGVSQVVYGASVPLGLLAPRVDARRGRRQVALTHGHEVWWASLARPPSILRRVAHNVDSPPMSATTRSRGSRLPWRRAAPSSSSWSRRSALEFHRWSWTAPEREALGIPQHAPVVVCVARLVRRKGQDRLIRIWPEVCASFPTRTPRWSGTARTERGSSGWSRREVTQASSRSPAPCDETRAVLRRGRRLRHAGAEPVLRAGGRGLGISYLEAAATGLTVVPRARRRGGPWR